MPVDLKSIVTGDDTILVEPPRASLGQLQLTNRLQMVRIDNDVLGVAESLRRIDPGLMLMHDGNVKTEQGNGVYVIYWKGLRDGQLVEEIVTTAVELDQRITNLIRKLDAQGRGRVDLNAELARLEREKDAENARRHHETFGPLAEQLRFALRKDLGATGSQVFMSGSGASRRSRPKKRR